MADISLSVSEPDQDSIVDTPNPGIAPLVLGTILLDRYTIVEVLATENGVNVYRVAEMRRCLNCGVENEGGLTHCGFCGTELPAARTLILSERPTSPNGQMIPSSFMLDGMSYAFARDMDAANEPPRTTVQITHSFVSDPGLVRGSRGDPNEDSILTFQLTSQHSTAMQTLGLFVVADGVGGAEAGELASQMAIQAIAHTVLSGLVAPGRIETENKAVRAALSSAISEANARVLDYGQLHDVPLGSTLTLALVLDNRAFIANLGDSRTYLFRDNELVQITHDHSYVAQLVAKGEIATEQVRTHPQRNLILRSLGDATGFEPDIFPDEGGGMELLTGDQILLCSDGLWEMVSDEEIANVLRHTSDLSQACAQLTSFANAAGGIDNISAILVQIRLST